MGRQVVAASDVRKLVRGVSASRELFERAAEAGAQMLPVHHGLFWEKDSRRIGVGIRERLRAPSSTPVGDSSDWCTAFQR
jgi:putative NIF3 family GTP cyclohydrolase 1 type 2